MSGLLRDIRTEFHKTLTTRIWWVLALAAFLYILMVAGGMGLFLALIENGTIAADAAGASGTEALTGAPGGLANLIYGLGPSLGYVFPVLMGALLVTSEFRHSTRTPTFLADPARRRVLAAKFVTGIVVGAFFGVVLILASVGSGAVVLSATGLDPLLSEGATWAMMGRSILAMAAWAALGVGLGALVPNQTATIVIVIGFTQFVEPLARVAAQFSKVTAQIGQYLPGAASDALVGGTSLYSTVGPDAIQLAWPLGGVVLVAYALVFVVIGHFTSWRRDVT